MPTTLFMAFETEKLIGLLMYLNIFGITSGPNLEAIYLVKA